MLLLSEPRSEVDEASCQRDMRELWTDRTDVRWNPLQVNVNAYGM